MRNRSHVQGVRVVEDGLLYDWRAVIITSIFYLMTLSLLLIVTNCLWHSSAALLCFAVDGGGHLRVWVARDGHTVHEPQGGMHGDA